MALELVFGGIAAVLSGVIFWFALPNGQWRTYPSYEVLHGWLFLLASGAFVAAAYGLRSSGTNLALQALAIAWAVLLLYCLSVWPMVLRRVCLLAFFMSVGVTTATVLAGDALIVGSRGRALRLFGLAVAGAATVAMTVWLGATGYAELTAEILLMLQSGPYLAEGLEAFELPVALGLTFGLIVGASIVWRRLRSVSADRLR